MRFAFLLFALVCGSIIAPKMAAATSGPGCLRVVNVAEWDVLNMRARPSAQSRIVDRLTPGAHGIISLDAPCFPLSRSWGSRWCPVTHYSGNAIISGFVKARYIRNADCP